jgi:hypothetical protein
MAFPDRIAELDRQIAAAVERAVAAVRADFQSRLEKASAELRASLAAELPAPELPAVFLAATDVEPLANQAAEEAAQREHATTLEALRDSLLAIDGARTQAAILEALLAAARHHASRAGVFLLSPEGARGWAGDGFAEGSRFADLSVDWNEDEAWRELGEGRGAIELTAADCARLLSRIEDSLPLGGALVPLVLRDRLAATLYADRLDVSAPWSLAALQALTWSAALALETLAFRDRTQTPTLLSLAQAGSGAGLAIWDPGAVVEEVVPAAAPAAAVPAPAAEEEPPALPAPVAEEVPAPAAIESAPPSPEPALAWQDETPWEPAPAPEVPAPAEFPLLEPPLEMAPPFEETPVAPAEEEPVAPTEEEPAEAAAAEWRYEEAAAPVPPAMAPEPVLEAPLAASPAATETPALELPPLPPLPEPAAAPSALDMSEDATYLLSRDQRAEAPRVMPPPAVASTQEVPSLDEESTHPGIAPSPVTSPVALPSKQTWQGGGSTEVAPPPDLQGPGWAFATTRIPTVAPAAAATTSEDATHDEARRLARLLVSEIKLYNEEQVEDGRRNRDIYERLKEDIDRSRQMYEERVDERIRNTTDYFYQELVRILAGGDPKAMGI